MNIDACKRRTIRTNATFLQRSELDTQRAIRQMYYAATTYVDDQIGRLLQGLTDSGMDKDTVVMLVRY